MFKHVSESVEQLIGSSYLTKSSIIFKLIFNWEKIVGSEISALCFPVQIVFEIDGSKLILGTRNSGFMLRIKFLELTIKEKISSYLGKNLISSIRTKVIKQ